MAEKFSSKWRRKTKKNYSAGNAWLLLPEDYLHYNSYCQKLFPLILFVWTMSAICSSFLLENLFFSI